MRLLRICDFRLCLVYVIFSILTTITVHTVAKECGSLDLRNSAKQLERLRNCTVIKGFLLILLMENEQPDNFTKYTFPELREITEYLLFYRVFGLRSLGSLFPNLVVIRGQRLLANYAFIVYEMNNLAELGLRSLISIQNGHAIILYCPMLCFSNTIDWSKITNSHKGNYIEKNDLNRCPSRVSCRACDGGNCWSSIYCQKYEHDNLVNPMNRNCHHSCLGGCYNSTAEGCYTCKGPTNDGVCVEKCPDDKLLFPDTFRCYNRSLCLQMNRFIFENKCLTECPPGYSSTNYQTNEVSTTQCFQCQMNCVKVCNAVEVQTYADAKFLKGCNIVHGSLSIKLEVEISLEDLEDNLGEIEEIDGHLKIYRSMSLTTLSFFRSLHIIKGNDLVYDKYALVVYENYNLQSLFNWKLPKKLIISQGSMFFHSNTKLCPFEIDRLQAITKYNKSEDFIRKDISLHEISCNPKILRSQFKVLAYDNVTVFWEQEEKPDEDPLEYLLFYIEAPSKNVSSYVGSDMCLKNIWRTSILSFRNMQKLAGYWAYNITGLKQNTQYAFYVRTYITGSRTNYTAQTDVKYFVTMADTPTPPIVYTLSKTHDSLTLEWRPATEQKELITYYKIDIFQQPDKNDLLQSRNYCLHPMETEYPIFKYVEEDCCTQSNDNKAEFPDGNKLQCMDNSDNMCTYMGGSRRWKPRQFEKNLIAKLSDKPTGGEPYRRNAYNSENYIQTHVIRQDTSQFIVKPLKHYRLYTFHFFSCNDWECGTYYMHSDRTARLEKADDIKIQLRQSETDKQTIIVQIIPPTDPNAMTLAYHVYYVKHADIIPSIVCVPRYQLTIEINKLDKAPYQVRARALSLAGLGRMTQWSMINLTQVEHSNGLRDGLLALIGIVIIISSIGFLYTRYLKSRPTQGDEVILMSDLVPPNQDDVDQFATT